MAAKRKRIGLEPTHPIQQILDWYQNVLRPVARARGDVESDIASKLGMELLSIAWRGPSDDEAKWLRQMWATRTKIQLSDKPEKVRQTSIRRRIDASLQWYAATKLTVERASDYVVADLSEWFKCDSALTAACKSEDTKRAIAQAVECLRDPRHGFAEAIEAAWKCFGVWATWDQYKQSQRVERHRNRKKSAPLT